MSLFKFFISIGGLKEMSQNASFHLMQNTNIAGAHVFVNPTEQLI